MLQTNKRFAIISIVVVALCISSVAPVQLKDRSSVRKEAPRQRAHINFSDIDHVAQEQRVAVQIITTDPGDSASSSSTSSKDKPNGAITFDDQYDMMSSKLDQDPKNSKLDPKRIIINLSSLLSNATGKGANSEKEGGTKMTIGFSTSPGSTPTKRPPPVQRLQKAGTESKTSGPTVRASVQGPKEMRDAVMDAIKKQGGIPTVVVEGGDFMAASRQIKQPRMQFMVTPSEGSDEQGSNSETSDTFRTIMRSISAAATNNEANLRDQVDGLSNEVSTLEPHLDESRLDEEQHESSEPYSDDAERPSSESSNLRGAPLDNTPGQDEGRQPQDESRQQEGSVRTFGGSSGWLSEGSIYSAAPSRTSYDETASVDADSSADEERAESGSPRDSLFVQHPDGEPRSHSDKLPERSRLNREPLSQDHNSNLQQPESVQEDVEQTHAGADNGDFYQSAAEPPASSSTPSAKKGPNQQQTSPKPQQKNPKRQQRQQANKVPIASGPKSSSQGHKSAPASSSKVDERVAKILDHLKLYTTKEHLMKVARDLEAYPTREEVESDEQDSASERQKAADSHDGQQQGWPTNTMPALQPSNLRHLQPRGLSKLPSSRQEQHNNMVELSDARPGRNKVPPPVAYEVNESSPSSDVDSGASSPVPSESLESPESNEAAKVSETDNGIELLDKFLQRQKRMRSMSQLKDFQDGTESSERAQQHLMSSAHPVADSSSAGDGVIETPDTDSAQVPSAASQASLQSEQDKDVHDYVSNGDIVDTLKSNERAFEADETQNHQPIDAEAGSASVWSANQDSSDENVHEAPQVVNEDEVRAVEQVVDELEARTNRGNDS